MTLILRSIADLAVKFLLNFHLLLIIIFSIFYFVPGAYLDEELIVESSMGRISVAQKKDFFLSIKDSIIDFYTLDFGMSFQNQNSKVLDLIWKKAKFSFQYLSFTVLILFFVALAASYLIVRFKKKERILFFFKGFNQIPQLVLIPGIIYFFAYLNSFVPLTFDPHSFTSYIFVVSTLVIKPLSQLIHLTVEKWSQESGEVYAQFARAKGLGRNRIILVHTFKNIANSFLGYFLTIVLQLLTGNFILESLYSIPGFGLGFMDSVLQRDLPLVIGYIFLFSSIYLILHFLIQIIFLYVNPRLREST